MPRLFPPRVFIVTTAALAAVAGLTPATVLAEPCTPISLVPGGSASVVEGVAPATGTACYTLSVQAGQTASLAVEGPNGMAFSVWGEADNRTVLSFTTRAGSYRIDVFQTFRAALAASFRLDVSVGTGAAAGIGASGTAPRWSLRDGALGATGMLTTADGTEVMISCDAGNRTREMAITAPALPGLPVADGAETRAAFAISRAGGEMRFPVLLRRYGDGWWRVEAGLTTGFLDAFAAGARMRLEAAGQTALEVGLGGTSAVRVSFRRHCGM
ncbi:MAG: hypothetical protein AAF577_00670 [Pseudomonadota bacterium]